MPIRFTSRRRHDAAKHESHPANQSRARPSSPHRTRAATAAKPPCRVPIRAKTEASRAEPAPSRRRRPPRRQAKTDARQKPDTGRVRGHPASTSAMKIQAALLWSGDYAGTSGGDDPMLAAIKNFQKRIKAKVTGVLTPTERERPDRRRRATTNRNSAGAWWSIPPPASASACRPRWCRMRATRRAARAGPRRMARCRSKPSASRIPASSLPRCSSAEESSRQRAGR